MHIAYISFEHPLGQRGGGIGIYVDQIAVIMAERGHAVEVFTSSVTAQYAAQTFHNYTVHLIPAKNIDDFRTAVVPYFNTANNEVQFDVIESAEYGADGLMVKQNHPDIPLVVKLHTPDFLVKRLNFKIPSLLAKLRFMAGSILRGRLPKKYWKEIPGADLEKDIYKLADAITSPSQSLAKIVADEWGQRNIKVLPNPYVPSAAILNIKHKTNDAKCRVLFIGRLEQRKGIYTLLSAIPDIIKADDRIYFSFAGSDQPSYKKNKSVQELMTDQLKPYLKHLNFLGFVDNSKLHEILSETDICVLPSIWENFPNVCLEAMSAGIAVIGTNNGGMADMITHQENGFLIEPSSPKAIAEAIMNMAGNEELRAKLGVAARQKVLTHYNAAVIGKATEGFYLQIIHPQASV